MRHEMKLVTTKMAKRVSGLALLMYDMQFAARAFDLATKCPVRSPADRLASRPSAEAKINQLIALDPLLRRGAAVAQIDADHRNESEAERCALFEAGVITYARCFTNGSRTQLKEDIFKERLSAGRRLHQKIMTVRNKHIAHSELKMELSFVGCQLVDDANYGRRPNLVMALIAARRDAPSDERLQELKSHCDAIVLEALQPRMLEAARSLREQLLKMRPEDIDRFKDFGAVSPVIEELL
jgi:hypothetical protein